MGLLGKKTERKKDKVVETPRQIAEKHAYRDTDGCMTIPTQYVVGALLHVASDYKQKSSSKKSLKAIMGGVFRPETEYSILTNHKNKPLKNFEVDIRKATNHRAGAVAVCRPRMDEWCSEFTAVVDESLVSEDTINEMLNDAGKRAGIGSFRVAKGGYFGQFQVVEFTELN